MKAFAVLIVLVLALAGVGSLLSRIDRIAAEQRATAAQLRYAEARLELATIVLGRRVRPDPRVDVLVRRTAALRGAIFALVRTGAASMTGDPGGDWGLWEVELGIAGGSR